MAEGFARMHTYYCPCGYSYRGDDSEGVFGHTEPLPGGCCNCGGLDGTPRKCMSCVLRYQHDECEDDCPDCRDRSARTPPEKREKAPPRA